ncbi:major facilitator superfamily domain-containing protein [Bombardia bombarda]|uniref:Major facilitator superfamily domain-containing protein n=1 Tax=Bombardia bombarda TaxID=252184 RepID=A0AA39WHW7_9PEZI|nr:major facilitator superfamily domain-containing protein [Bombardia bombarda]
MREKTPNNNNLDVEKGQYEASNTDMEGATIISESTSDRGHTSEGLKEGQPEDDEDRDLNIISWDGPNDQENPKNWTMKKRWLNVAVLSILTLVTPLGSSMFAPGIPKIMHEFGETSSTTATFLVSIYVLGFAFGPLFVAPLSEIYGRSVMYNGGNILFVIFTVCVALSNGTGMMLAFRFLMGVAGSVPITIGSGSIADMMPVEMRGRAMAAWALGPLLGPCIGPVAGGFLIRAAGWRWVYWLIAILAGIITVFTYFTLHETYAPVILQKKVTRLQKETGNPDLRSKFHDPASAGQKLKVAIARPMTLLFTEPIITSMSIYVAITYGILYLLFTTFSFVYTQQYGFDEGTSGLTFLPAGLGMMIGIVVFGAMSDGVVKKRTAAGLVHTPEIRVLPSFTVPAGLAIPTGLFIYGWTAYYGVHWIVSMIGVLVFAAGLMGVMMCIQNYLLDSFPTWAASTTAALAVLRSLAGALLPLGGLEMYNKLGLGWGNSLLGFISLALVPIPIVFYVYGARIRRKGRAGGVAPVI